VTGLFHKHMSSKSIHLGACVRTSFTRLGNIPLDGYTMFVLFAYCIHSVGKNRDEII
jgi:hypothetical protein